MTTPPTSRYFKPISPATITRLYEIRSDGVSIAFPKDNNRWVPASLTGDEALKKPHLYAEVDINGTPLKDVNRNNINNELGLNLFGRLESAITAAEQRNWKEVRATLTDVLTFLPSEPKPEPEYRYFLNIGPMGTSHVIGWRIRTATGDLEVFGNVERTWTHSIYGSIESVKRAGYNFEEVPNDPSEDR